MLNLPPNPQFCQTDVSGSTFVNADCFDVFPFIEDKSIDAIICDLPYGYNRIKWDFCLPLDKLWEQYKRIIKPNGSIILFASQPFTSELVMSNLKMFKHEWVWDKHIPRGFQVARYRPMRKHEDILVFCSGKLNYKPIMELRDKPVTIKNYSKGNSIVELNNAGTDNEKRTYTHKSPDTIIKGFWEANGKKEHTSQKPLELLEYLVKTYTNENDMVLDNTMGSGTTNLACIKLNRKSIGIEKEKQYYDVAVRRASEYCH
jgi:site-specific DNA-methyltransferase (adenine-specific)